MHAIATIAYPSRQCGIAQGFARGNVFINPFGHLLPTRCLPDFKWAHVPTEAPAYGEINVARVVSNVFGVYGNVMEHIAHTSPQELGLWVF